MAWMSTKLGILFLATAALLPLSAQDNELHHRFAQVNGIKMHYAEQGRGPLVVLVHGFPESWYSWRHQLTAVSAETEVRYRRDGETVVERTSTPTARLRELLAEAGDGEVDGLEVRRATLEDVYLALTGEEAGE